MSRLGQLLWTVLLATSLAARPRLEPSLAELGLATACAQRTVTRTKILYRTVERVRCPVSSLEQLMRQRTASCSISQLTSISNHSPSPVSGTHSAGAHHANDGHYGGHYGDLGYYGHHGRPTLTDQHPHVSLTRPGGQAGSLTLPPGGGSGSSLITASAGLPLTVVQSAPLTRVQASATHLITDRPATTAIVVTDITTSVRPTWPHVRPSSKPYLPAWPPGGGRPEPLRPLGVGHRPSFTGASRTGSLTVTPYTRPPLAATHDPNRIFIVGRETIYFK